MGRVRRTKSTHEKSRSPRRRLGAGGRINISGKLFAYFTLFTAFILLVVWVMQIGLLNYNPNSYVPWMPLINFDMGKKTPVESSDAPRGKSGL